MNIKKITFLILLIVLINIIFIPKTFAFSDIISAGDDFLNSGDPADSVIDETKLSNVSSKIYNILLVCGIGVAVIVGAVLGITFIMSSAEGKAKVSETLVPYIVGCFVVFGAFGIWKIAIEIGNDTVGEKNPAMEMSQLTGEIDGGKVDVADLSDDQLRKLWSNNRIDTNIADKVKGSKNDPRSQGKGSEGMTVDEAINTLGSTARKIYDECEKRGLVEKTETGVKLKDK